MIDHIAITHQITIPVAELAFRFSTSSGPGGQHVNKTASRVTLIFDLAHSPSLPEEVRARLLETLAPMLDKAGNLQINVQSSRSQQQNREIAISRLQMVLVKGLYRPKPRHKTKPSRTSQEKRLAAKKRHGRLKQERGQEW